jgi:hypothetical protein
LFAGADGVPGGRPEVAVPGRMIGELQGVWCDVGDREVGDRIAIGLEEQKNMFALGDPGSVETHAHAPTERFDIQEPLRQRFGNEESTDCARRKRTLLPGQSHCCLR